MEPETDNATPERFTQMEVWRKAHQLALQVIRETASLTTETHREIGGSMRRLATGAAASLSAGISQWNKGAKYRSYMDALEKTEELHYHLILCRDMAVHVNHAEMLEACESIRKMVSGLIGSTYRSRKKS